MEIHIQIRLKGTDFPAQEELNIRHKLENMIEEKGIGEIIDMGGGIGVMDIYVEVDDRSSIKRIRSLIQELKMENITTISGNKQKRKSHHSYREGDIVRIPLDNNGNFGYGRILIKNSPMIFMEFYKIVAREDPAIEEFKKLDWIMKIYCSDMDITDKGSWKIIGNIPVIKITMPLFWQENIFTKKLYLLKDPFDKSSVIKETTLNEIQRIRAQPSGAGGSVYAQEKYKLELKKVRLL